MIFRALSCDSTPHWTTLAAFVSGKSEAIAALFEEVLLVCEEEGLIGKELLAIDGCKMPSNAAKGIPKVPKSMPYNTTVLFDLFQ